MKKDIICDVCKNRGITMNIKTISLSLLLAFGITAPTKGNASNLAKGLIITFGGAGVLLSRYLPNHDYKRHNEAGNGITFKGFKDVVQGYSQKTDLLEGIKELQKDRADVRVYKRNTTVEIDHKKLSEMGDKDPVDFTILTNPEWEKKQQIRIERTSHIQDCLFRGGIALAFTGAMWLIGSLV